MAESDRETGCIGLDIEEEIEEGRACAGCEKPVTEETGVECFCAAEDFSRSHETYRWCTKECFYSTHEIPYPMPAPHPDE